MPTTFEVFVIWHPDSRAGDELAPRIYEWLRPTSGMGPDVYFRSLPAPGEPSHGLPLPLPRAAPKGKQGSFADRVQVVIPLIDENMIAVPAWRQCLSTLHDEWASRLVLPVALDPTAYNAPPSIRALNFLRPSGSAVADPKQSKSGDAVTRSLLRQLTEALARLMLGRKAAAETEELSGTAPKVRLFLSHAKRDGVGPTRRIREHIYANTQVAAFFDENDIPYGSAFSQVLERDAQSTGGLSAAMIAVRTAEYAKRPWCRWELSEFRKPVPVNGDPKTSTHWQIRPLLIVEAMEGGTSSVGIPELGNAPVFRWTEDVPDLAETVVTQVLRDAVLGAHNSAIAQGFPGDRNRLVLNWRPDPTTLLRIPRVSVQRTKPLKIIYPGRDLPGLELDVLAELFPNIEFLSFQEASR